MDLSELMKAAERHPLRWALGSGFALGLLYGILYRAVLGGVLMGVVTVVILLVGHAVQQLARRRP